MSNTAQYVVAVSGGVDSIVLLDALANNRLHEIAPNDSRLLTHDSLIIAHFNHGIREDSSSDEQFVRGVVGEYGLTYESVQGNLGPDASEETARKARYNFLRQCCKKYKATLITAHHQDDLIETMIINLIRGTGWRGLTPMTALSPKSQIANNKQSLLLRQGFEAQVNSNDQNPKHDQRPTDYESPIWRPLLNIPKSDLITYAKKYNLKWREDSTNKEEKYLRNYVRRQIVPAMRAKDSHSIEKLLQIHKNVEELKNEIATELQNLIIKYQISNIKHVVPRHDIIMWPFPVAQELIYAVLTQLDPDWHPTTEQLNRAVHFIKVGLPQKKLEVSGSLKLSLTLREVQFSRESQMKH